MSETMPRSHRLNPAPVPAFFLYGEAPRPPDEATVHVETIAARSRLHDWSIEPHRHRDLHQLLIVHRGRMEIRLDDHAATVRGSGVIMVPPGIVHGFRFERGTVGLVASFAGGLAQDLAARAPDLQRFMNQPHILALSKATFRAMDLAPLSAMVLREFARSALGRECALRGLLGALVANAYRVGQRPALEPDRVRARERDLVAEFRQVVERDLRSHCSIADYCRAIGVSPSQLRRACLAVTGQPPTSLVHSRLLIEAERQLRYTAMSIREVAYYLGFEDPAYFSRFFARGTGVSPKAFRAGSAATTGAP